MEDLNGSGLLVALRRNGAHPIFTVVTPAQEAPWPEPGPPAAGKRKEAIAMFTFAVSLLALGVSQGGPVGPPPAASAQPELEIVHVDGSRSPELIPQWSVWGYVFRIVSGGPRQLPTSVLTLVSKEEEAL